MALVDQAELLSAAAPGRLRELIVGLYARVLAHPGRAGSTLSGAQRELRTLRSRQRRWAIDALYDLIRHDALLRRLAGGDEPLVLWLGLLVKMGLDPKEAEAASGISASLGRCADWDAQVAEELAPLSEVDALALYAGVDAVVAEQLLAAFGDQAHAFVDASNERAPVTLRANRQRTSRDALLDELAAADIAAEPGRWAPDALVLAGRAQLQELPAWKLGNFEVQDEGSQLLSQLVQAEGVVVDLCAGAGGKALALAADGAVRVVATDVREGALRELRKRANRARTIVEVHLLGPKGQLPRELAGLAADRVLVDAPCTGLGVLRRHPEHRLLLDADRLRASAARQLRILELAATLVGPGGWLVYGTCSPLPIENRDVVSAFLERNRAFALRPASAVLGGPWGEFLETAPHTHGTDAFFGAVLVRQ